VPEPSFDPTLFNWDTDMGKIVTAPNSPVVNSSTDLGIFKNRGGKIMFYHGGSDGGPPVTYTVNYYNRLAARYGGVAAAQAFARLYLVPNMGHCSGGPSTDQFDFLTPVVNWVEKGTVPETVIASGTTFSPAPAARSRPLCSYPKTLRYTGPTPATTDSIAAASSYTCS
jgi:feruloyl esterase